MLRYLYGRGSTFFNDPVTIVRRRQKKPVKIVLRIFKRPIEIKIKLKSVRDLFCACGRELTRGYLMSSLVLVCICHFCILFWFLETTL